MTTNKPVSDKLFNVIITDRSEWDDPQIWIMSFILPEPLNNPEQALRAAIDEYCKSPEGQKAVEASGGEFNWGDIMLYLPDEYVLKHGMIPCSRSAVEITVDHDETLYQINLFDEEESPYIPE